MYSFSYLEPVCCSMSSSNCCFLICIQISQEAGQVVWYSHLLKNFPQFVVIHTVKGFGIVNEAKVDAFLEFSFFFYDPTDVQAGFRKGRGVRDQIANMCCIIKKAREFQKNTSALLTMPKPLTVWITTNCGKFFKR